MDNSVENKEALHTEDNPQLTEDEQITPEKKERYLQQIEGSRKEAERKETLLIETYSDLVSQDASHLDRLHDKDPKLADKVAKSFGYDSYKAVKDTLDKPEKSNNGLSETDLEDWYQKRRKKDEHELSIDKAQKLISKLPEDIQDRAKSYFDIISDGKTLTSDLTKELVEMATLYVSREKISTDTLQDGLTAMSSIGMGTKQTKKQDNKAEYVIRNGELTLISND